MIICNLNNKFSMWKEKNGIPSQTLKKYINSQKFIAHLKRFLTLDPLHLNRKRKGKLVRYQFLIVQ